MRRASAALLVLLVAAFLAGPAAASPDAGPAATALDAGPAATALDAGPAATALDESAATATAARAEVPTEAPSESDSDGPVEPDPALENLLTLPMTVERWFTVEAQAVARSGAPTVLADAVDGRAEDLTVGTPRPVLAWSSDLMVGNAVEPVVVATTRVVAPVLLDGTAVGVVVLETATGTYVGEVRDVPGLGPALAELDPEVGVVEDGRTGAWYAYAHGRVSPLDDRAGGMLAGSTDLAAYLPFLLDPEPSGSGGAEREDSVRWVVVGGVVAVGAVLLAAGIAVWLRGSEEEDESPAAPATERLRARVRAELREGRSGRWSHRG
ncbi:hypothetical protein ACPYO6_03670 [Georgenia sp. Z1344]|uniref:hypothetical protein n=1 Tax=Georgenia sp. Z1344 TaxID=3416706 RepID=UPI003CFAFD08